MGKLKSTDVVARNNSDLGTSIKIGNVSAANTVSDAANSAGRAVSAGAQNLQNKVDPAFDYAAALVAYGSNLGGANTPKSNLCFRAKVNALWKVELKKRGNGQLISLLTTGAAGAAGAIGQEKKDQIRAANDIINSADEVRLNESYIAVFNWAWNNKKEATINALAACTSTKKAKTRSEDIKATTQTASVNPITLIRPYDRRMDRLYVNSDGGRDYRIPFDTNQQQASTVGFIMSERAIIERDKELKGIADETYESIIKQKEVMRKDDYYIGLPSLINTYSITKLYGSRGGEFLLDQKGKRAWYEIDQTSNDVLGFSKNPTTTSIIDWGNRDPYGRTPYHFTDFAFCKYWNLIPNNRMITLRRFAAPIYDNMKFPGMDGLKDDGTPAQSGKNDTKTTGANGKTEDTATTTDTDAAAQDSGGSGKKVAFPPMATAITYFGEETQNKISELLKFTTGFNWDEATANLHEVRPDANPDSQAGPGGRLLGGMTKMAEMFNIGIGNFDNQAILNGGQIPPDPYVDGPYENRIIGPVNRIQAVKKRKDGLQFENSMAITFEYVNRPIGGVNPKAALLDILSNFMVIGSASAVFWGGQHRFMGQPQKYPFIGGDKGIQQWYRGDPVGWGSASMESLATKVPNVMSQSSNFFKEILGVFSAGSLKEGLDNIGKLASGTGIAGNAVRAYAAEKSSGQIPYLQGMKALLIGEPVGEWHVTMGNPLNPIAMIGNLIVDHIELELNDELGPDDFPTEIKITVNLEHGMARDRDAIQSIFNRGMGRIYELPDDVRGSADYETAVDNYTRGDGKYSKTGRNPDWFNVPIGDSRTNFGKYGKAAQRPLSNAENVSVWTRPGFKSLSGTQNFDLSIGNIDHKSEFRAADWVYLKALK